LIGAFDTPQAHSDQDLELRGLIRQVQNAGTRGDSAETLRLLTEFRDTVLDYLSQTGKIERGSWSGLYLYTWQKLSSGTLSSQELGELLEVLQVALQDPDFEQEIEKPWTRYRKNLGLLTVARIHDLRRERAIAEQGYQQLLALGDILDPTIAVAAQSGLKKSYSWTDAQGLYIAPAVADLVGP
jgi:hypothetical protein